MKDLSAIHDDPLNSALREWPCVWSLHAADGRVLAVLVTQAPCIIREQFRLWEPQLSSGGTVIQWNHGRPAVSYAERP